MTGEWLSLRKQLTGLDELPVRGFLFVAGSFAGRPGTSAAYRLAWSVSCWVEQGVHLLLSRLQLSVVLWYREQRGAYSCVKRSLNSPIWFLISPSCPSCAFRPISSNEYLNHCGQLTIPAPAPVLPVPTPTPRPGPTLLPIPTPRADGTTGGRRTAVAEGAGTLAREAARELPLAVLVVLGGRRVEAASEVPGLDVDTAEPRVPLVFLVVGTNPPALAPGAVAVDRDMGFETALLARGIAGDEGVLRLLPSVPVVSGLSDDLAAGEEASRGSLVVGAGSWSDSVHIS